MSVRCLFIVQGEGRGHLTQALSLRRRLRVAGHQVAEVIVGKSQCRTVPSFFRDGFDAPVSFVDSPSFVPDEDDRSVRPWATLVHELTRTPTFLDSLATIQAATERHDPDVIVNFFEPLGGFFAARYRPTVPMVAIGHQYMFQHPDYQFPPGRWWKRIVARTFASVTAWGAARRLALSLYPVRSSSNGPVVLPPLLREAVFQQSTEHTAPFFLVYILNSGYAREIIQWHEQNPAVPLHCFWDRPDAAEVDKYDDTLTFHQLDDEKFLSFMARCRGFVSTAGFESVAEARYLGTPVQVVPVEGHFEQLCNAFDTVRARAGIRSRRFDLSQLQAFLPHYTVDPSAFREWVKHSRDRFVCHIEAAAERRTAPQSPTVPDRALSVMKPAP
ncbi:glycosyltransferase [Salinibacter sp. 10B]|uniref:glycosyltransferase family protein n=1 Tax=Salinibacter sp. 10B TaxID=1923971 RepID=UPI000CF4327B|nr:glycosyltransferase family protein [Salinibacter sp. 10B]PQJ34466.1 glycosyltransferase [Salinibacter sp. 10B]